MNTRIETLLGRIYDEPELTPAVQGLEALLSRYRDKVTAARNGTVTNGSAGTGRQVPVDHTTAVMITYGDQFSGPEAPPLRYLGRFLEEFLSDVITGVHVLPFCPYSSDDGFSVIDYRQVDPSLGTWEDLEALAREYMLMADLVLNHCSVESEWFRSFLAGKDPWTRYFITVPEGTDLSTVVRPRALPVLTAFETANGVKQVWTTFSADQVDLNFAEPDVLLEMIDIFLMYIVRGVDIVRLDAIAYLWKEIGTSCIHHPRTHAVVKLFRAIIDELAPNVIILTETNVPHQENISYFGDGSDEARMVYQFSLPPLSLDAFIRGDATHLTDWASGLPPVQPGTTFFNFLASHDGVGVTPTRGYLSDQELENLLETVKTRGGRVSYKDAPGGKVPYELNINYLDAVAPAGLPVEQRARIFLTAQAIMLSMAGVPGIYLHSLIGSRNWQKGVEITGMNRSINREKLSYHDLLEELEDDEGLRRIVLNGYRALLEARRSCSAFHPSVPQRIPDLGPQVFAVLRGEIPAGGVLCLHNVSDDGAELSIRLEDLGTPDRIDFIELVSGDVFVPSRESNQVVSLELQPFETVWLVLPE